MSAHEVGENRAANEPARDEKLGSTARHHILANWKDIALYVGKSVRTVQRWELELGLPVRRPYDGSKSPVFVVPAELDAWMRAQKFRGEGLSFGKSEKTLLLRALEDLRQENKELRRQLEIERAKK